MAVFTRALLSGSTSGKPIPVAAIASPGTLVHIAVDSDGAYDEVYLFAANVTNAAATLTIEWGGTTDPAEHLVKQYRISPNSPPLPIAVGQVLNGAVECRAFSGTANAINITGYITRIQ